MNDLNGTVPEKSTRLFRSTTDISDGSTDKGTAEVQNLLIRK